MNTTLSDLMEAMIQYDCGDVPRIQHFIKVHDFAAAIGTIEGLESEALFILEAAAILHDIGIHPAEQKYGNCNGKAQEELGPNEALQLLNKVENFTDSQIKRICWLIAHHHTYNNISETDHRILLEADFLVNSYEDNLSEKDIITFRDKIFKSPAAIRILNKMWNLPQ